MRMTGTSTRESSRPVPGFSAGSCRRRGSGRNCSRAWIAPRWKCRTRGSDSSYYCRGHQGHEGKAKDTKNALRSKGMTMKVKDLFDLSGKVALITGGSRGLGLQMAEGAPDTLAVRPFAGR